MHIRMKTLKLMSSKEQTMVMDHSNIHTIYIILCIANRSRWKTFAVCRIEL